MNFLLPDRDRDARFSEADTPAGYGVSLYDIFRAWLAEDDPDVSIRFIDETLQPLRAKAPQHASPILQSLGPLRRWETQIVVVHSDGDITVDDTFIPALSWYQKLRTYSIFHDTLADFASKDILVEIDNLRHRTPTACAPCKWLKICGGGDLENRYSSVNGFDNSSVYCDAYKHYFDHAFALLITNGLPASAVEKLYNHVSPTV